MKLTALVDREGMRSVKSNSSSKREGQIDLSLADMDFMPPVEVKEALYRQITNGVLGYCEADEAMKRVITQWYKRRYFSQIKSEELIFGPGMNTVLSLCVEAFTKEQDEIIVMPPVYAPFILSALHQNRRVREVPFLIDHGKYDVDFMGFEEACKVSKMFFLCSPHNPITKVFSHEELRRLLEIAKKYHVLVVADEIHCDWSFVPYTSASSIDPLVITLLSASKTFNLQSMQTSLIYIHDKERFAEFTQAMKRHMISSHNGLAYAAYFAAYSYGEDWLNEVKEIVKGNINYFTSFLKKNVPDFIVYPNEGTYLVWVDVSRRFHDEKGAIEFFEKRKIDVILGSNYFATGVWVRLNLATGRQQIVEVCRRLYESEEVQ